MEYRSLELTVVSAEDLKNVNLFSKMNVYVVVSILDWVGDPSDRTKRCPKQRTPVDKEGHRNPSWNFPMKFAISEVAVRHNRLSLLFQIRCRRMFPCDKAIGEVYVPLTKLLSSIDANCNKASIVSYQISKPSGKPKGVLNLSYSFPENPEGGFPINLWSGEGKTEFMDQMNHPATWYPPLPYATPGTSIYPAASGYPVPGYGYPLYPSQQDQFGCRYGCTHPMPSALSLVQEKEKEEKEVSSGMGKSVKLGLVAGGALAGILIGKVISNVSTNEGSFEWWF